MSKWIEQLSKEVQMANKYIKKCSTYLSLKEIHIKTTSRFHLIPVRMAGIIKKQTHWALVTQWTCVVEFGLLVLYWKFFHLCSSKKLVYSFGVFFVIVILILTPYMISVLEWFCLHRISLAILHFLFYRIVFVFSVRKWKTFHFFSLLLAYFNYKVMDFIVMFYMFIMLFDHIYLPLVHSLKAW
jgi:hypothetical protein